MYQSVMDHYNDLVRKHRLRSVLSDQTSEGYELRDVDIVTVEIDFNRTTYCNHTFIPKNDKGGKEPIILDFIVDTAEFLEEGSYSIEMISGEGVGTFRHYSNEEAKQLVRYLDDIGYTKSLVTEQVVSVAALAIKRDQQRIDGMMGELALYLPDVEKAEAVGDEYAHLTFRSGFVFQFYCLDRLTSELQRLKKTTKEEVR